MIVDVDVCNAVSQIIEAAHARRGYSVSTLAVHGVISGVDDDDHRCRLNSLGLLAADGQPVRLALSWLYSVGLRERVYGPKLMLDACQAADDASLPIYLCGGSPEMVSALRAMLAHNFSGLIVAGTEPFCFATNTESEIDEVAGWVRGTGARLCFVGLGCARQEVFVYQECRSARDANNCRGRSLRLSRWPSRGATAMGAESRASVGVSTVPGPGSTLASVCPAQPALSAGPSDARDESGRADLGRLGVVAVVFGEKNYFDPLTVDEAKAIGAPCD